MTPDHARHGQEDPPRRTGQPRCSPPWAGGADRAQYRRWRFRAASGRSSSANKTSSSSAPRIEGPSPKGRRIGFLLPPRDGRRSGPRESEEPARAALSTRRRGAADVGAARHHRAVLPPWRGGARRRTGGARPGEPAGAGNGGRPPSPPTREESRTSPAVGGPGGASPRHDGVLIGGESVGWAGKELAWKKESRCRW